MATDFRSNSLHEKKNFDHAALYIVYVDDQVAQVGRAAFAVMRKAKLDLLRAVDCMLNDVLAICVLTQVRAAALIEQRITSYQDFFSSGLAGDGECRLFYLCLQQQSGSNAVAVSNICDGKNRDVCVSRLHCQTTKTFEEMKSEFQKMKPGLLGQLSTLAQSRGWDLSAEACVMGLQCRVSELSDVLLMIDKDKPLSGQVDINKQMTLLADVSIYLLHLAHLLDRVGLDWSLDGMAFMKPLSHRPWPVKDTDAK